MQHSQPSSIIFCLSVFHIIVKVPPPLFITFILLFEVSRHFPATLLLSFLFFLTYALLSWLNLLCIKHKWSQKKRKIKSIWLILSAPLLLQDPYESRQLFVNTTTKGNNISHGLRQYTFFPGGEISHQPSSWTPITNKVELWNWFGRNLEHVLLKWNVKLDQFFTETWKWEI